ncbi:hypothetical protein QF015_000588 [Paenarthrobacter sp. TE4293]|uniref:HIRAN domain-containing protein n=1 Tax=Paenarthrobacter sp. TE4293 TaxID=3381695 RepID=UPI003D194AF3
MREVRNRLTASGKPIHIRGNYEASCPGAWLHYDYLAEQLDVGAIELDGHLLTEFAVIPEPANPYDPNAVAVSLKNRHIGYLPADIAAKYAPILTLYIAQGLVPLIEGQLYVRWLPANEDHPEPKKWVDVHLYVEDICTPEPVPVWNIPGTKELTAEGAGLLDYEAESYWATAQGPELDALREFTATFVGDYALARLVLLPSERPSHARRIGIQHGGVTLGRLSAVSSGRYREQLLASENQALKLAVVIRICTRHQPNGFSVLIPRHLGTQANGLPEADFAFDVEKPPVAFDLVYEIPDIPEVSIDFETLHLWDDSEGNDY